MRTIFSSDHRYQDGKAELVHGTLEPCYEMPRRAEIIHDAVKAAALGPIEAPRDFGIEPVLRVHASGFVEFLSHAWSLWTEAGREYDALPLNWRAPGMRMDRVPSTVDGLLSYYSFDAGTPITAGTWRAITASANVALTGAAIVNAGERTAFSLCRPPGHHAGSNFYGGYCFLNNAAIAAQWLRDQGAKRVCVLDVDYHHGNGTQEIFWTRPDVLFVSIHSDPIAEYPYFLGYADETGAGAGEGTNLNLPLPHGTDWMGYAEALDASCRVIEKFSPDVVVVSFGADTFETDPISQFKLKREDYRRMGARIARLNRPIHVVMEGGYAVDDLGLNTATFLAGIAENA